MRTNVLLKETESVLPSLPAYNRDIPNAFSSLDLARKLSIFGVGCIAESARLCSSLNVEEIKKASSILYDGLTYLSGFEVRDKAFAGTYTLTGRSETPPLGGILGGRSPLRGNITEEKPSAYQYIQLSGEDTENYLSGLSSLLLELYEPLNTGFRCNNKNDRSFQTLIHSLYENEKLISPQVIATNDYLRNILADSETVVNVHDFLKKKELEKIYNLKEREQLKLCKDAGISSYWFIGVGFLESPKPRHPFEKKLFAQLKAISYQKPDNAL